MKRALLAAAVPLIFAGGNLATRALLMHAPSRLAGDLAQPLPVVTAWNGYGAEAFAILALTLVAAALAAFLYAVSEGTNERTTWFCALASAVVALAWPVVYSSDVYAYAAYGEMALHGINPYLVAPAGFHAPFADLARRQWSGTFPPCVYGTLFVELARQIVALFGRDPVTTLFVFRVLAAGAWLGAASVFSLVARRWFPERRASAVALFALHPLGVWCAAEGHNDALMMLLALLGALAVARGVFFAGGLVLGLTPLVKAAGVAAGVPLALYVAARTAPRSALVLWCGYAAGLACAVALVAGPMWPALTALRLHGTYAPQVSLQSFSGPIPALALAGLATLAGLRSLAQGDGRGALWLALALPLALPNPYPWYMMWVLPVAAAARRPAGAWLWAGTIAGSLRYLPDALGPLRSDSDMLAAILSLAPFAITAVVLLRAPAVRPQAG